MLCFSTDFQVQTEEEKYTPLHFASRYQPRYHDDDIERQEYEEDVDSGAPQVQRTEEDVSYLASSKKVMKLLVKNCEVDVSEINGVIFRACTITVYHCVLWIVTRWFRLMR